MINYPFYDAIHEKSILHKRGIHMHSPKAPPKPKFTIKFIYSLCFIMHELGIQTVFYELEM